MNVKTIFFYFISVIVLQNLPAQNWEAFSNDTTGPYVEHFYVDTINDLLYIGGRFKELNGQEMRGITVWDGEEFHPLMNGVDNCGNIYCHHVMPRAFYKGELYCSTFGHAKINGVPMNGICRWNGQEWNTVGGGLISHTSSIGSGGSGAGMLVFNDELYVTGLFHETGNVDATLLAKWDGEQWLPLDIPQTIVFNSTVHGYTLALFNEEIYIGGNFYLSKDGVFSEDIIKFDGTELQTVANGSLKGSLGAVRAIAEFKDELYIGGSFRQSEGNPGTAILKLKDNEWVDVGGSFHSGAVVRDMVVYQDKLYVFGLFNSVGGGVPARNVATWDGEKWCGLGSYFEGGIMTGAFYQDQLHIGGGFKAVDSTSIKYLARWIGGDYVDTCGATVSTIEPETAEKIFELFPNPASHELHISITGDFQNQPITLSIFNILGERLFEQRGFDPGGAVDVSGLSSGTYILQLQSGEEALARKFVVQR